MPPVNYYPKTNPNLDPNPNPNGGGIFLGGQLSGYLDALMSLTIIMMIFREAATRGVP